MTAIDLDQFKKRAVAFARNTSTEISPHDEPKLESHPAVDSETLWKALAYKQAFAQRTGVKRHLIDGASTLDPNGEKFTVNG